MTLLHRGVIDVLRLDSVVEDVLAKLRDSVSRVLLIGCFSVDKAVFNENAQAVAGVSPRQIGVVCDVTSSECEAIVQHAKDGHVGRFHPLHLAMHKRPVKSEGLYMTGLNIPSHVIALHRLRYCELDISSWGMDMHVDHASDSTRVHYAKKPGLPSHRESGVWLHSRMYNIGPHRHNNIGGKTAAQRRRERCTAAPAKVPRCKRPDLTATNHTRTAAETPQYGGGRHVRV